MKVLKFGGSSIANVAVIRAVFEIIKHKRTVEGSLWVVFSALENVTNELEIAMKSAETGDKSESLQIIKKIEDRHIQLCKQLIPDQYQSNPIAQIKMLINELEDWITSVSVLQELTPKSKDKILGFGELLSTQIMYRYFKSTWEDTLLIDSRQFIICSTEGELLLDECQKKVKEITFSSLNILPGFVASNTLGVPTTLGRGGSDYTASILSYILDVDELEIWSDVKGLMTANPRDVPNAHVIRNLSYEEAFELSHFGAKVLYPLAIQPALLKNIPILIKNTFQPEDAGTQIARKNHNKVTICGLSSIRNISLLNLRGSGMVGIPKFAFRLFQTLSQHQVNVIMITQASSEHTLCIAVNTADEPLARKTINDTFEREIEKKLLEPVESEQNLAILALVGNNIRNQVGVSGQMFSVLGRNGINIKAIAQGSSERNISIIINEINLTKALNVLHESFFKEEIRRINLFMIGVGNVGKALIQQITQQQSYLEEHYFLDLRLRAVANSKKMYFEESEDNRLDEENYLEALTQKGISYSLAAFLQKMEALNLRNSIFLDVTAASDIPPSYPDILQKSIAIVTPNKIGAAGSYPFYQNLKYLQKKYRTRFLYETNVCAGLPVISTLTDLIKSGDRIHKIQAVLSGTLNFLFNEYNGKSPFATIVKRAKEEGYSEPDPRLDLSGEDVRRKILILARECGYKIEISDIQTKKFVPQVCMDAQDVATFFQLLEKEESHFNNILQEAKGKKIRYVAQFDKSGAKTGLEYVDESHPFYHLEGSDNIILFYTDRYVHQPLVVKGAGAGASVTASGIFADIMRIVSVN